MGAPQPTLLSLENEQLSIMCAFFKLPFTTLAEMSLECFTNCHSKLFTTSIQLVTFTDGSDMYIHFKVLYIAVMLGIVQKRKNKSSQRCPSKKKKKKTPTKSPQKKKKKKKKKK